MKTEVLCICQCCCDIIFAGLNRIPSKGSEEYCHSFAMRAGGGANTAMGLARLGTSACIVTDIGTDELGRILFSFIQESGVSMRAVKRTADTAVSAVMSYPGDRSFASYAGCEAFFRTEAELALQIQNSRHVHTYLGYALQFDLARLCRENGATLSLDVSGCEANSRDINEALKSCTVFKANEPEALSLTGCTNAESALSRLADLCQEVVITLGSRGCIACINGQMLECDAPKIKVLDATGAGDLFFAGYLHARLNAYLPEAILETAALAGALAVTRLGGAGPHFNLENMDSIRKEWRCK